MNEMSEQPRPVRAWAETDDYQFFIEMPGDDWAVDLFVLPRGGEGAPYRIDSLTEVADCDDLPCFVRYLRDEHHHGPLRTLRVLLSTGHEVLCDQRAMVSTYGVLYPQMFSWELRRAGHVWFDAPHGSWKSEGCSDSESVARAISEAVAWIREQEGGKA